MQIKTALQNANTVAIISHRNPMPIRLEAIWLFKYERWGKVTSAC